MMNSRLHNHVNNLFFYGGSLVFMQHYVASHIVDLDKVVVVPHQMLEQCSPLFKCSMNINH